MDGAQRDDEVAEARYRAMRWNIPLSEEHATRLINRLAVPAGASVLDLGCGWGQLLIQTVMSVADADGIAVTGIGVDTDASALARGVEVAGQHGLTERIAFHCTSAATWTQPAERVLCTGATHAWGGARRALIALATLVAPGGRMLFGDGFWERPPTDAARDIFGENVLTLAGLHSAVRETGWHVIELSCADQREWDEFESTWRAGRQEWLLAHRDDPEAPVIQAELDAGLREYLTVYRGMLGFCYFVLSR